MRRILLFILLSIPFVLQAQQDVCSGALTLCATSSLNATTAGATVSGGDPALTCGDLTLNNNIWFKVVGIGAGTVTVTVSNIDNNPGLAMQVYTGSCASLVPLGPCASANGPAGSMNVNFATAAGVTYYIMVDGQGGNGESFSIQANSGTNSIVARPVATLIPNPTNGCAPLAIALDNNSDLYGGTNITYQWRVLPGGSYINSTGADTTIILPIPNSYQVELRVCNAECGCNSSLQDVVVQNLVPTIGFSPANSCLNNPITFNGGATIEPPPVVNPNVTSWAWNFGDPNSGVNNTASGQNVVHTFVGPGSSFTVRLIVDGICGPDTVTRIVALNPRTRVSVSPPSLTVCQGSPINLAATMTNATNPVTFLWSGPPTIVSPNSANTAITGLAPGGPYVYTVHTVDANACVADTTVNITVRPKPVVSAGPDDTVCVNTLYMLDGSVSAGIPPLTYTWSPATGLSSSTLLTPTTTLSSTRTYCLTARDNFGCVSDSDCVTLSVYPRPSVSANPAFLCTSMNPPLQTTFTVSGLAPGSTYSWRLSPSYSRITSSLPDSSAVTATFPATVATYNFTVTTFNPATGCRDTLTTSFSVVAGIAISAGTSRTICAGTTAPLTASNASAYLWTATPPYAFADPTQANQTVSPTTTTTFVVRGTTGSCYEEDTVVITVRPKPVVNAGADDTICVNTPTPLNGSVSAGLPPLTYTWSPATGLSSSTVLTPTASINSTRTYCLMARDSFGCVSDTNCVTLSVYPLPSVSANPSTLCASLNPPLQSVFTVSGGGAGSTYRWRLSANYSLITGSNADSSVVTATFPPGIAATYTFRVIVFNPATGCRDTIPVSFTVTAGLNMSTTSNQTLCAGDSAFLSANNATTYLWTASPAYAFADPTQSNQTVTPTGTTTFFVRGTTGSCYDEDTVVVTVRPKPVVNAGADDTICQNTPTPLNGSVSAGLPPLTYTWSPATGLSSSTLLNPTASINSTRTYCLMARDSFGCVSDTNCVTLSVYPLPSVSANPSTLCASLNPPLQSVFTVTGGGAGSTYRWRLSANYSLITGSNSDSSVVTATFPPGIAATYTFRVIVFNPATGCRDTIPVSFTVTAGLNMTTTANRTLCAGDSVTLTANNATTYLWSASPAYAFADPTQASQTVKPTGTTTFFVRGTTGSCYDEDTVVVTVRPKPVVNAGADDTLCSYTPTTLNGSVITGLPPLSYTWSPATGLSSSTVLNPTAIINSTRTYCLMARDSFGCTSDTNCVTLNVYPKPQINTPSILCASQAPPFQATFDVTGAAAGSSYSWTLSLNYSFITSASPDSSTITATFPTGTQGSYTFIAVIVDAVTGCTDTVSTTFTVDPGINMSVSANSQVCPGDTVTLTAGNVSSYAWTSVPAYPFVDSTSNTQTVILTSTTTFYVTGSDGTCSDIDTIVVTVNPPPAASIADLPVFCRCDTVTLNGSNSMVGAGYLWTSLAGNTILNPTLMNASVILCANDTITLRVTDPNTLCTSTDTVVATPRGTPSATATVSPDEICDGVMTLINLTGAADPTYSFSWTSIPAATITDTAALSTTASASTATVFYLTVSDTMGCDTTVTDTLHVFPFPVINASFPFLCTNDPVLVSTISITGAAAGSTYVWDVVPGCVTPQSPSGPSQSFDFATCGLGSFQFVVTVTDAVTGCIKTLSQTVSVVSGVTLNLTPNQSICEGDSVALVAAGANTFLWNTGSTNDTLVVGDTLVASATPYVYYVTGTIGSCTGTDTVRVTVNPRPVSTPISGPLNVCENQLSVYTITTVPGVTYTWTVSGGVIASGQGTDTLYVNWGTAGPGVVSVADTNTFGCPGTPQSVNVTINVVPPQPTVTGIDTVCVNEIAVYSVPSTAGLTYSWSLTNGTILGPSNNDSIQAQWSSAGPDTVILVVTNAANCSSDSGIFVVEVLPIPAPNPITGNSLVCASDTNQLYVIRDSAGSVFQWSVTGGTLVSGQGNDSLVVNWDTASAGSVTMTETGANGCPGVPNVLNVTINTKPVASASPDSLSLCRNESASLSGTVNTGAVLWITSGTGTFDDSVSLTPVYTPGATDSGYIYLSLIASNAPCDNDTDVVVLNISPSPVAGITSSSSGTICYGTPDTLTASGIGTYLWLPDSVSTPTLLANPTDTTVYSLIVTNSFACSDTATMTLNVIPPGIATASLDQWVCRGDSVLLTGTVLNAPGLRWITNGDGTFIPDVFSSPVTYIPGIGDFDNGSVEIILITTGACSNLTDTVRILITPYPVVFAGNDTTLSEPATLPLHGSVIGGAGIWYTTGTGIFNPNDTVLAAIYEPSQNDYELDSIIIYLESTWSCRTVIDSFVVKIFNFEVPNVFTPYPSSPGYNDYFIIRGLKPGTALKIWDRWGLLVYQSDNYRNDWDAAELKSDTYYYILSAPDREVKGWVKVMRDE